MTRRVPEKAVQAQIVRLLRTVGAQVYVIGTRRRRGDHPGTMQTPGLPDLYAFVQAQTMSGGRIWVPLWIECKGTGGRIRPEQAQFAQSCLDANHAYVVGGLDAVIAQLVDWGVVRTHQVPAYRLPDGRT